MVDEKYFYLFIKFASLQRAIITHLRRACCQFPFRTARTRIRTDGWGLVGVKILTFLPSFCYVFSMMVQQIQFLRAVNQIYEHSKSASYPVSISSFTLIIFPSAQGMATSFFLLKQKKTSSLFKQKRKLINRFTPKRFPPCGISSVSCEY